MAEPINNHNKLVLPAAFDMVGGGSATTQYVVDQLSVDYNATVAAHHKHSPSNPFLYSWDAVNPKHPLNTREIIKLKAGCPKQLRPNGSSSGIAALSTYGTTTFNGHKYPCIDFARSSRPRKTTDPSQAQAAWYS